MITETETTAGWKPIEGISWRCNGGINPLILNHEQLVAIAGDELNEAMRWVRIHCECFHVSVEPDATPQAIFAAYRASRHRYGKPGGYLPGISTVAQFVAKHGGTDSRPKCACLDDLLCCFDLCGSYNGFDADVAKRTFEAFTCWPSTTPTTPTTAAMVLNTTLPGRARTPFTLRPTGISSL